MILRQDVGIYFFFLPRKFICFLYLESTREYFILAGELLGLAPSIPTPGGRV